MNKTSATNEQRIVATALASVLADTYVLALKTQNYHWNVTGPEFVDLHELFGKQYAEMADAVDEIAERIRALRVYAPGGLAEFKALTSIADAKPGSKAMAMVEDLLAGHETLSALAREVERQASEVGDQGTADLMVGRMQAHDKAAWMMRSILE